MMTPERLEELRHLSKLDPEGWFPRELIAEIDRLNARVEAAEKVMNVAREYGVSLEKR